MKSDYVRAADYVRALRRLGAQPMVVDAVIDAYLLIFQVKKSFNLKGWFDYINHKVDAYDA